MTVDPGQPATFTVIANGSLPLTYQWRRNGTDLSGASANTLVTSAMSLADQGAAYSVVVTNSLGSVTSANAILHVNIPPSITAQPQDTTVPVGLSASFSVAVSGTAPFQYQWRENGTAIPGATSATYTIPDALTLARQRVGRGGVVVVCGSLSLVGAVRGYLLGLQCDPPVGM